MMKRLWLVGTIWAVAASAWAQGAAKAPAPAPAPAPEIFKEYKSIMFSDQEIIQLKATEEAQKIKRAQEERQQVAVEKEPRKRQASAYYTYPQFYLGSLAYYSAEEWTFWLNGKKYTPASGTEADGVTIESVLPSRIIFTYKVRKEEPIDLQATPNDSGIQINTNERSIMFALSPNQTFSTYGLRLYEGRIQPVTVALGASNLSKSASMAEETLKQIFESPPTQDDAGLEGLINRNNQLEKPQ
jgi:hypothetical protein